MQAIVNSRNVLPPKDDLSSFGDWTAARLRLLKPITRTKAIFEINFIMFNAEMADHESAAE